MNILVPCRVVQTCVDATIWGRLAFGGHSAAIESMSTGTDGARVHVNMAKGCE